MEQQIYTTQEINQIINFDDPTGRGSGANRIIPRCARAGLIIEPVKYGKGNKNHYKIIQNNINLQQQQWITCYLKQEWEVSSLGRLRKKKGKQPIGSKNTNGYVTVCTQLPNGKVTQVQLHRLIYFSFYPNQQKDSMVIDHIDGRRDNNKLSNLRCLTNIENLKERDQKNGIIKTLTTELVIKYGYESVQEFLTKAINQGLNI